MKITVQASTLIKIIGASILAGAVIQEFGRAKWPSAGMVVGFGLSIIGLVLEPPRSHQT